MLGSSYWFSPRWFYVLTAIVGAASLCFDTPIRSVSTAEGQCGNGGRIQQVGGIQIDPSGAVEQIQTDRLNQLRKEWEASLDQAEPDMQKPSPLRKVSLRKLEEAMAAHLLSGTTIPDDMKLLAGLQSLQYVFVYPEEHDIVLAGFGEGWKMDARGNIVGPTTGRPVLALDDLLVALRFADQAAQRGITCSIDPTPEGLARLREFVGKLSEMGNPQQTSRAIEQALGPQIVTIGGVPPTTHVAHVLAAADYRLKRLSDGLDPSPVPGLVSHLKMAQTGGSGMQAVAPRFWLVPNYQPVLVDPAGLAYEVRGTTVKCLTEDMVFGAGGARSGSGKSSPAAQKFADAMTAKYDALAAKEPAFAELQGVMNFAIVAALIKKENLAQKAGHTLPLLLDSKQLPTGELAAVKRTDSVVSMFQKGSKWIISASGGVQIDAWGAAKNQQPSPAVAEARAKAGAAGSRWWWD